jgi:hypothetical protein
MVDKYSHMTVFNGGFNLTQNIPKNLGIKT